MTPTQALALYEKACATHARKDWRLACHALARVVMAAGVNRDPVRELLHKPAKPPRGKSLLEFLADRGIRDAGGELRARDAELWHRAKPFRKRLIRDDGVSLEAAALSAWEAGFFPHVGEGSMDDGDSMLPVTEDMLLDAIDRELAGRPIYADSYGMNEDDECEIIPLGRVA